MNGKVAFVVGAAFGYLLGTRAGREQYDKIKGRARQAWEHPAVQEKVGAAETAIADAVREQGAQVTDKVAGMVKERLGNVGGATGADDPHEAPGTTGSSGAPSNGPDSAWDTPHR